MSELDDLLAVYGRIDDAVTHDRTLLPRVAAMLPPYRAGAAGWYRAFQDWHGSDSTPRLTEPRTFEDALDHLGDPEVSAPSSPADDDWYGWSRRHWLNARRMLASATWGRIQGQIDPPRNADPLNLLTGIATGTADPASGAHLHGHMRRAAEYPTVESWPHMMAHARNRDLVSTEFANSTYVPPIQWEPGSFRTVQTSDGTSIALRTHYHALDLTLDAAKRCLVPDDWKRYRPPWCDMQSKGMVGPNVERFLEVVATDCAQAGVSTILDFRTQPLPDGGAILEYRIPEGPPVRDSDESVSIDEGSLEIRPAYPAGTGVHFVTTKRVQFRALRDVPSIPAAMMGFLVWAMGWDTLAERFLYFLAQDASPNLAPTAGPANPVGSALGLVPAALAGGDLGTVVNLGLSGWQSYVSGCLGGVRDSVNRAESGSYGLSDYLGDLTKLANEVADNTVSLAQLGAQIYRTTFEPSTPAPGSQRPGGGGGAAPPGGAPRNVVASPGTTTPRRGGLWRWLGL